MVFIALPNFLYDSRFYNKHEHGRYHCSHHIYDMYAKSYENDLSNIALHFKPKNELSSYLEHLF